MSVSKGSGWPGLNRLTSRYSVSTRSIVLIVASLLLMLLLSVLASRSLATISAQSQWLAHTERIRVELGRIFELLLDVQNAAHGYALSRNQEAEEAYRAAAPAIPVELESLEQLVADDAVQRSLTTELQTKAREYLALADRVVAEASRGNLPGARALMAAAATQQAMDSVRSLLTQLRTEDLRALESRRATNREALREAAVTLRASIALSIALLLCLVYSSRRDSARLRRVELELATTLSSVGDGVIATDTKGAVQFMNGVAEQLTGLTEREAQGLQLEQVYRVVDPLSREPAAAPIRTVLQQKRLVALGTQTLLLCRDGSEHTVADTGAPVLDEGGEVRGVVLVFRDVTADRVAERALNESHERYGLLAQSIHDILVAMDRDLRFTFWNSAAESLTGISASLALGKTRVELFGDGESVRNDERRCRECISSGQAVVYESEFVHQGKTHWLDVRLQPTADGVTQIARDITERKAAEGECRRLLNELETVLDVAPVAIWIAHDPQCQRLTGNRFADQLLNIPHDTRAALSSEPAQATEPYRVFQHGRELAHAEFPARVAARTGQPVLGQEVLLVPSSGNGRDLLLSSLPLFDVQGDVRGSITVAADITAQKRTADALRASEARFRAIQDTSIDGFMVFESVRDEDGNIVDFRWAHVNEGAERIVGKPRSWFIGRQLLQEHPGNRDMGLFDGYVRVVDTGTPWSIEFTYRYDGLDLYLRLVAAKCDDGVAVSFADLTERRRAEEQLRARERQFVGLANAIPNLAWTEGADGAHQYFNRGWYEYTGLTEQQSKQADSWTMVVHQDDQPRVTAQWLQSLRTGWPFEAEFRMRRHDGVYRWFLARATADRNPEGTIVQWFGTCTDIDATKAIEGMLRHTETALRAADTRKDVFLATLSHELRNSLAPIGAAARLLESAGAGSADPARCGSIISRQVTLMAALLDDLLDISKISRGTLTLKKRAFNLREILQAAVETAQPLIDAKQHELSVELPSAPAVLQGDSVRLTQVVANLLTNAAKYTEAGGHITLGARIEAGQCVISVRDTGEGLTPEMLNRVFDLYTQAEPSREQSQSGLGIGLALSKGLIELHGGRIEARSAGPDLGSEFTVSLPLSSAQTDAPPVSQVTPETHSENRKSRRILIADDNRDGAESLALLLQLSGHQVHVAHTGVESLDMALRLRPEIAILDIGMPGLNGYEVARRIRRERWSAQIVLIAVTGWGQLDDKREALAAGFDHHLTKPVDPEVLERLFAATPEASRRNA